MPPAESITDLLRRWSEGDTVALETLVPRIYPELKQIAGRLLLAERRADAIECTALVHEAYIKLVDQERVAWNGRAHFFAATANIMRRLLVDRARQANAAKRGSGAAPLELTSVIIAVDPGFDITDLNEALTAFEAIDPESARTLELRYFGGLSIEETALVTGTSPATVKRQWSLARAWLYRRLRGEAPPA